MQPLKLQWVLVISIVVIIVIILALPKGRSAEKHKDDHNTIDLSEEEWQPPDTSALTGTEEDILIRYGRNLIARTSFYFGKKGKIAAITNGMNCQNCHLDAGTKAWGNNYSAVFSTYPKFRERSGTIEGIYKRINDCLERSLNGKALDTNSREMQAIYAYIKWLGQNVKKGIAPAKSGIKMLPFLNRPAEPGHGREVYILHCQRCHGVEGQGWTDTDSGGYIYPPLWGNDSYNTGAGLYRLSRFAGYIKENMPFDAPQNARRLTDEEAWDVAAFINSQPRPQKNFKQDWPDISGKPVDYPFGPYVDSFSEYQHKYGPFEPIAKTKKNLRNKNP